MKYFVYVECTGPASTGNCVAKGIFSAEKKKE